MDTFVKSTIVRAGLLSLSVGFLFSQGVSATNGYSAHGFGTKSKGMAGAGVAFPQEGLSGATNPALSVHLGNRIEFGGSLFSPLRGYTADNNGASSYPPATMSAGSYDSTKNYFLIPHFAWNQQIDDRSSIGVLVSGNGGMNTQYDNAVFSAFNNPGGTASAFSGVDLMQLLVGFPYSYKLSDKQSVGIMPIIAAQAFKSYGLEPFRPFSQSPNDLTNNDRDYSFGGGVRIGWYGEVSDQLSLGASYQSRLYMQSFDKYKGLFAEQGNFDIPDTFTVGLAYKSHQNLTWLLDIQHIRYSSISAIGNPHDVPFMPGSTLLGTDNGVGFGWDDMTIFKFGVQWQYRPDLILRAGYSQGNQIIPDSQGLFNILAPAVVNKHFSVGLSKLFGNNNELNVGATYAPNQKVTGSNPNTGPQTGSIEMEQWELELNWTHRF
jgi:long-chain fatty acid transport protein